jgi:peroxiredoxin
MQLVQLQEGIAADDAMAVYAVSYDPVDTLAGFAAEHSITYPLLSDVGSVVIEELGLLNTEIEADQTFWGFGYAERHHRLPFPGTFVLAADGTVESKHFHRNFRNRDSSDVLAGPPAGRGEVSMSEAAGGVRVTADVARRTFFPSQLTEIRLRLEIADGLHVYVPPLGEGYQVLDVSVDGPEGFHWDPPELPDGAPYRVDGLDEDFRVVEGTVDLGIPFHVDEAEGDVTPEVVVTYQTCTDTMCNAPASVRLALPLTARPRV